ncbi:2,3-bisphosphoglycerate-independent phosphoglycerate mutase [bacterium]|nr:2,3-bisphosphoglycerate-independent phosphoglycerate mutase [bacterium]
MLEANKHIIQPTITGKGFTAESPRQPYAGNLTVLLILDGWGIGPNNAGNAISLAKTPNMDLFWLSFPHAQLAASGEAVGLPKGEDGNSETGHVNIGAGNIVYQDLPRVNMSISDGTFQRNPVFLDAFEYVKKNNSALHVMGLAGSGGVHANLQHMLKLIEMAAANHVPQLYLHLFTDGRDSPPYESPEIIRQVQNKCQEVGLGEIASVMGRFYAMDRDLRWDRVEAAYDCLTSGLGEKATDPIAAVELEHQKGNTDEFVTPTNILDANNQVHLINDNDAVIFTNYRIDRPRELTRAFVLADFGGEQRASFDPYLEKYEKTNLHQGAVSISFTRKRTLQNLYFVTMTRYEDNLPVAEAFPPQPVKLPVCKIFANHGLKQLRASETEKERFVTYYMNGQKEFIYPGEDRVILPSKGERSYDLVPEMSAYEITNEVVDRINNNDYDVMIINLANGDMVGHTGNLQAGIKACEVVDECVGHIARAVYQKGGNLIVTADHGNVEEMIDMQTGNMDTEHSTFPVPFIVISPQFFNQSRTLPNGVLADIAPTMLGLMGLPQPDSMTGRNLLL